MPVIANTMKDKLAAGANVYSFNIVTTRYAATPGIAAACGFDWLFIDTEHNTMDLDTVSALCIAALPVGITPIVRVAGPESFHATRVLDGGAQGIIVPHVNSAAEARQVVDNCKFPPIGHRSVTAPAPQLGYESMPASEAMPALNDATFIIVMVETPEAMEAVDEIAAVEGVDCVLMGTNDLCATMGIPGQIGHEKIVDAYAQIVAACDKAGNYAGMGGVYDEALMEKYMKMGVRVAQGGGDTALMMAAGKARMQFLRTLG